MKALRVSTNLNSHAKSWVKNCRGSAAAKSHLASRNAEIAQQRAARANSQLSSKTATSGGSGNNKDITQEHVKLIEKYAALKEKYKTERREHKKTKSKLKKEKKFS